MREMPLIRHYREGPRIDPIPNAFIVGTCGLDPKTADSLKVRLLPVERDSNEEPVEYRLWIRVEDAVVMTSGGQTGIVIDVALTAAESLVTFPGRGWGSERPWIDRDVLWPIKTHPSIETRGELVGIQALEAAHQRIGVIYQSQHFGRLEK
jgi:hypothetical protein